MLPNPCVVKPNPYLTGTYKHDFIEWWNLICERKRYQNLILGELFAEAAEAAYCAGTYGLPPKESKNEEGSNGKTKEDFGG